MNLLEEIRIWASGLPGWQSDMVRRLFSRHELRDTDISEFIQMVKVEVGLVEEKDAPTPQPITKEQLKDESENNKAVALVKMYDVKNANALVPNQTIDFSEKGITIIYGENAVGKSGYSRVLKRACWARDDKERIHPNIFSGVSLVTPASASFEIITDGETHNIQWVDGKQPPKELRSIAVFDSKCARLLVAEKNVASYVPYGLDIFPKIVDGIKRMEAAFQSELRVLDDEEKLLAHVSLETAVGKFIANLSESTKAKDLESLAVFSDADALRHKELRGLLDGDPVKRAQEVRSLKIRIEQLGKQLKTLESFFSNESLEVLKKALEECKAAEEAVKLAGEGVADALLPGVGTSPWKEMYEAAKKYSEITAYPKEVFPMVGDGARCVFCHQILENDARDRLRHFKEFVDREVEKSAKVKRAILNQKKNQMDRDIQPLNADATILDDIGLRDPSLKTTLVSYLDDLKKRSDEVTTSLEKEVWVVSASLGKFPGPDLNSLVAKLEDEAAEYDKAVKPGQREKNESELKELEARRDLLNSKDLILRKIKRLQQKAKLSQCISKLTTTGISRKGGEFTEKAITGTLKDALEEELKKLGVKHITLDLKKTVIGGVVSHQLIFGNSLAKSVELADVLSEGEQRVVGIASFLGELCANAATCGIVFDDPVSSLDHHYRERVAHRLVDEARSRQVIVFTHDIMFLLSLERAIQDRIEGGHKIPFLLRSIERMGTSVGICRAQKPWVAMRARERVKFLRNECQEVKKLHKEGKIADYEARAEQIYGWLRETWERTVEEVLFQGSVRRFSQRIETQKLASVEVCDKDYEAIEKAMSKCSRWLAGHDTPAGDTTPFPGPDELLEDINAADEFISKVEERSKDAQKRRKVTLGL